MKRPAEGNLPEQLKAEAHLIRLFEDDTFSVLDLFLCRDDLGFANISQIPCKQQVVLGTPIIDHYLS